MAVTEWTLAIDGFEIDKASRDEQGWQIEVHPTGKRAACPCDGQISERIHSYYTRTLRDLPVAAACVTLVIHACRFECRNDACQRKVFCERLGGLGTGQFAKAHSRMSERLIAGICVTGFALNGEGGARLAKPLGMRISGDTVIAVV